MLRLLQESNTGCCEDFGSRAPRRWRVRYVRRSAQLGDSNLDLSKLTQIASILAALGVAMFGISAASVLLFRFFSIESLGLYIQALRFTECTPSKMEEVKRVWIDVI
jgi:hypothetical protein